MCVEMCYFVQISEKNTRGKVCQQVIGAFKG